MPVNRSLLDDEGGYHNERTRGTGLPLLAWDWTRARNATEGMRQMPRDWKPSSRTITPRKRPLLKFRVASVTREDSDLVQPLIKLFPRKPTVFSAAGIT